jgi:SWI/SNF-related matrix-associated actin-dependent regulator 1 of chromatin subfamily A
MTQEQFEERYCKVFFDGAGNRRIRGSKNIKGLRDRIKPFMLRRMKKDVQGDLPDLIFDDYPLPTDGTVPQGFPLLHLRGQTTDAALAYLEKHSAYLATWRNNVAAVKTPLVKEFAETELDTPGEKLIIFYHHTVMGQQLYRDLAQYQPVIVDGKTKDAQTNVDYFQRNPNCRVFLGQISACGEALNITAATQVNFAEASWSPSDNYQAACRAHRIGMGKNLVVRFLSLAGSTDELVQRVLARKAQELSELFD